MPNLEHRREPPPGVFLTRPEQPADGVPLAVKDLFDTAGLVTTYGSAVFRDHVPKRTASVVTRLEQAGYANVGKTNLHEFAYGITSVNPHYGAVPNPRWPGRMAGGLSGGAAVAGGLADAALGSDSGGSIRIPAACCGVVGFKPTYGLVALDGCFPLAPSFDHAGPLARDVGGCARMLEALAPIEHEEARLTDLAIGVAWLEKCEPLVRARVGDAAALAGARPVEFPRPAGISVVFMREVAEVHRQLFAEHAALYGEDLRVKMERCLAVTDGEYARGSLARDDYRAACEEAMGALDLLLVPTLAFVPSSHRRSRRATWSSARR